MAVSRPELPSPVWLKSFHLLDNQYRNKSLITIQPSSLLVIIVTNNSLDDGSCVGSINKKPFTVTTAMLDDW